LEEALALALDEKASTVTPDHLKRAALPKDKLEVELKTILLGEEDFARAEPEKADDALLASLGFLVSPSTKVEQDAPSHVNETAQQENSGPPKQKRYPGQRNPKRDRAGFSDEEQEQTGDDSSGTAATHAGVG
jgi:hypothetical protein